MTPPSTYRSVLSNIFIAACWGVFLLIGAAMASSTESETVSVGGRLFGALLIIVSGALILRSLRAGIVTEDDGVLVRSLVRTHRLPWSHIAEFAVGGSWSFVPWQTVTIARTDGTTISAAEVCSLPLRHPTLVENAVESLNSELARHRPSSTTPP